MEQSDARRLYDTIMAVSRKTGVWASPETILPDSAVPLNIIEAALAAARIEGERAGLERAAKILDHRVELADRDTAIEPWYGLISECAEEDAGSIRALAKELTP